MRVPICMQIQTGENGLAAMQAVLGYYKKFVPTEELRKYAHENRNGIAIDQLLNLGKQFDLDGEIKEVEFNHLNEVKLPCIISWRRKYYVVVTTINNKTVKIMDPLRGNVTLTLAKLKEGYSGKAIELTPNDHFKKSGKKQTIFSILRSRLGKYKAPLAIFVILDLILAAIGFIYATTVTKMIDEVVEQQLSDRYLPILIVLVCLFIGKIAFSTGKVLYNYRTSRKMTANSTSELFARLLMLPASFYEEHSLGELNERLQNNSQVDKNLVQNLIPRVMDTLMCLVYIVLMCMYNWILALVCLILEALNFVIVFMLHRNLTILMRSQTSSSGNSSSKAFNCFSNIETIKSMGTERFYFNLWNNARNDLQNEQKKTRNLEFTIEIITLFHNVIIATVFLFFGAWLVKNPVLAAPAFTLGMLYTCKSAFTYVKTGIDGLLSTNKALQRSRTFIERADDIKNRDTEPEYPITNSEPNKLMGKLEIKNLNYRYHSGDPLVLKNINIEVKPGEMIALVGSSGCGKTTLSKIISGIYHQESGDVLYDGMPRKDIPDIVFHSSIGSVDQETCIFADTISNNLKMFDDTVTDYEMILAARDAQIHNRIIHEGKAYDSMMCNNGGNFSGGEIQRIELARALSQEPTLLVLDEFTSALDALTEEKIFNAVRDKGTSAVIVAHRLSTIVNCDRIYVMDHGEIIEQGTHDELYALGGYYHQLVSKQ